MGKTLWEIFTGEKPRNGGPINDDQKESVTRRSFTATNSEWEHITEMAQKHGLSASRYIRLLILNDMNNGGLSADKEAS